MSERALLRERLEMILDALERIPRRFARIKSPDDFVTSQSGVDLMDSICMVLLATGEELRRLTERQKVNSLPATRKSHGGAAASN